MTIDAMLERLHAAHGRVYLQWATAGHWVCNAYDLGDADTNARHARGATPAEAVAGCFRLAFPGAGPPRESPGAPTADDLARDLAADLALCDAAVQGPWHADWKGTNHYELTSHAPNADDFWISQPDSGILHGPTLDMIAASREGWPAAIRRARAAEAEAKRLRAALPPHVREIAARLLRRASAVFSTRGCNDFELPGTPDDRAFAAALERWTGADNAEVEAARAGDGPIYLVDWLVMDYLAHLVGGREKADGTAG